MAQAGRIVVVTGCSRGMGRELITGFAAAGCTVVGVARNPAAIEALKQQYPAPHRFDALDVGSGDVSEWAKSVVASHGAPQLVVNNAGIINEPAKTWDISYDDFSTLIDVNVKGTFAICRALIPNMIQAGHGVIVNFSSTWGRSPAPTFSPYCASKYAVEGLTLSLARELPAGLAAVSLNPGVINTDMLHTVMGPGARAARSKEDWAATAVPFILGIGVKENGRQLSVP